MNDEEARKHVLKGRSAPSAAWRSHSIKAETDGSVAIEIDLAELPKKPSLSVARPRAQSRVSLVAKRVFDLASAVIGLVLLSPVFLVVAVAIFLDDRGSIMFRQRRVGLHGEPFDMVKFRTMVEDADESLHREHTARIIAGAAPLRLEHDPRITRVGNVLRRWSIDELPNLLNVLTGRMSIVGPRPLVTYEAEHLNEQERRRWEVKPGITGLAQVNGRLAIEHTQRSSYDVQYVDSHTFWMDLGLIVRTLPSILRSKG